MGTDIHAYIEYTNDIYSDDWRLYKKLDIMRSYALFGCLVDGLRGWQGFCPLAKREFPTDLSNSVADFYAWGKADYHSEGFIWCQELDTIRIAYEAAIKVVYEAEIKEFQQTFERWKKPDEVMVLPPHLGKGFDAYLSEKIERYNDFFNLEFEGYYILDEGLPHGVQDVRIVFWFDN